MLAEFRNWLRLLWGFLRRTREQYALEFAIKKGHDWGKGPHVHKLQATYKFEIEHQPLSGYYFPVVIITEKIWQERRTKDVSPHNRNRIHDEIYNPLYGYGGYDVMQGWGEPTGRWVLNSEQNFLYIEPNHKGFMRVDHSRSRDIPCLTHEDALKVIALYKERFLRDNVTTKHIETVNVTLSDGQRIIVH